MKLKELVDIIGGGTPSRDNNIYWNGSIPWVTVKDMNREYIDSSIEFITEEGLNNSSTNLIKKNSILIPTRMGLGRVAINTVDVTINQDLKALVPKNSDVLDLEYLFYFLKSKSEYLKAQGKGATVKGITLDILRELDVPLMSLNLQKQIVKVLNIVYNLIEKRQYQITALDELTQSLFLKMFGDPITNPKGWDIRTLKDFGEWKSGGTPQRSNKEYYDGDIPWLSSGELNDIYISNSIEHITEKAVEESSAKYIEEGSILLGMYDTAALKSSIVKMKCTCNQAIAYSKLDKEKTSTLYVYQYIQMAKEHLKRQQRGVRQKNMNLSMIKDLIVMYPPLELQQQFENKFQVIEEKKSLMKEGLYHLEILYNSLLQKAFKGELFQEQ